MKTVLLLGGRSFIGGHVCRALVKRGYKVLLHSTSSSADFKNLSDLLPNVSIETVSCALDDHDAMMMLMNRSDFLIDAAIPYFMQSIGHSGVRRRNLSIFESLLNMIARSKIKKSVFVSISGTIGRIAGKLGDETAYLKVDELKSWGHLKQKFDCENMILEHAREGTLQAVIVNPPMVVGEFDTKPSTGEFFRFIAQFPFQMMPDEQLNIIDAQDVGMGAVLALEKGKVGERYLLGGINTTFGMLIKRIKELDKKPLPKICIPRRMAVMTAYISECINLIIRSSQPLVPLMGIELIEQGSQHLNCEKAIKELGFAPHDPWLAVDRAYHWYKKNGLL